MKKPLAKDKFFAFFPDGVTFASYKATQSRLMYFPLCAPDSSGLKSSITPFLSGDIKVDKYRFLTKPASREDLRYPTRNFFVSIRDKGVISLAQDDSKVRGYLEAGPLWHKISKEYLDYEFEITAINFVPVTGENVELMYVGVTNRGKTTRTITPTVSIPIFGRALANKHDHEHVTALLQRIEQHPSGVIVTPAMSFNEEGHQDNHSSYFVLGVTSKGEKPIGSFPTIENFCGDNSDLAKPKAILEDLSPGILSEEQLNGKEAIGTIRFKKIMLRPGYGAHYFVVMGVAHHKEDVIKIFNRFNTEEKFWAALSDNKKFWWRKLNSLDFKTSDRIFNAWMKWAALQPILRRIYGCSFLPDHDYGKGGKGWRDIWQDLLSLILIEPEKVRESLINNFAGVRVDGSNATIVGEGLGEFIADRNAIPRVWMDHGLWPFLTTRLYIDQTGDFEILFKKAPYFRDAQLSRSLEKDFNWTPAYGNKLKAKKGEIYSGTVLEHILIQHLVPFFNVGEHNVIRLENADWNDGLDMAFERGESVSFMSFYGGNLLKIADTLEEASKRKGVSKISLAKELLVLLDTPGKHVCDYENVNAKRKLLSEEYYKKVQPEVSGDQVDIKLQDLIQDLRRKGEWVFKKIKGAEKVALHYKGEPYFWFNGYYDNKGRRVEGFIDGEARMTLTGQVFSIMSGLADKKDIKDVVKSVNRFLKDKKLGGIRLNTNFGVTSYLDLGRAFSFAYGTKENGAFFSHMNVMYAYALYQQGFARAGYEVIQSIYNMAMDTEKSKIYPGIPEYFDSEGRGMYHYLTGSASWLVLTMLTQTFGVRGEEGGLVLAPQLVKEQFNHRGEAQVICQFAGKRLTVIYQNPSQHDYDRYEIQGIFLNNQKVDGEKISSRKVKLRRDIFLNIPQEEVEICVKIA